MLFKKLSGDCASQSWVEIKVVQLCMFWVEMNENRGGFNNGENTGQNSNGSFCIILFFFFFFWEDVQMNVRLVWNVYDKKKLDNSLGQFAFTFEMVLNFSSSVSFLLSSHKFRCCLYLSTNNVIISFFLTSVTCTASLKVKLHWIKDPDSKVFCESWCRLKFVH